MKDNNTVRSEVLKELQTLNEKHSTVPDLLIFYQSEICKHQFHCTSQGIFLLITYQDVSETLNFVKLC